MKILDIINSPWGISSNHLTEINEIYKTHLKGEKIDFKSIVGDANGIKNYKVINNKAIIPVMGPLTPRVSFFSALFGGTSMEDIISNINQAVDDGNEIILHINSPGGTVESAFETADYIEKMKEKVSIIAFSDGKITSAAMLIASAAEKIFITGKTNEIGGIGVVSIFENKSKMLENQGIVVNEIVSGKYKNINSSFRKPDGLEIETIQNRVDYLFSIFANDISRRLSIPVEEIIQWEGNTFIGAQAIEKKIVDGVSTLEDIINSGKNFEKTINIEIKKVQMTEMKMEDFKKNHIKLYEEIQNESHKQGFDAGEKAGIESERQRITGIQKSCFPGQEELMNTLIKDGTSIGDAAVKFNEAQKKIISNVATINAVDAIEPINFVENQTQGEKIGDEDDKNFMNIVNQYIAENKVPLKLAMSEISKKFPEIHKKYLNGGK
jgi:signal peptide peptidase SppA